MSGLINDCGPKIVGRIESLFGWQPDFVGRWHVARLVTTANHQQAVLLFKGRHEWPRLSRRLALTAFCLPHALNLFGVEHPIAFEDESFALLPCALAPQRKTNFTTLK